MEAKHLDDPIADMTRRELRALIAKEVRALLSDPLEIELEGYLQEPDPQESEKAIKWLHKNRLHPPKGSPATLDLIRRDRDR